MNENVIKAKKSLMQCQQAYAYIMQMLPSDLTDIINKDRDVVTGYAYSLWSWLLNRFQRVAADTLPELWNELTTAMKTEPKWADYRARIDDIKSRIEMAGDTVSHGLYMSKLLYNLPQAYTPVVSALSQGGKLVNIAAIDWENVRAALEMQERQAERIGTQGGDDTTINTNPTMALVHRVSSAHKEK